MSLNIKKNLLWDYTGRFSTTIFSLITSLVLTRLLKPGDYGLIGLAIAINGVAGVFLNLGLSSAIIQKNYNKDQHSTIFWLNTGLAAFVAIIVSLLAPALADFFHLPDVKPIIYINAGLLVISSTGVVPTALLTKNMMFKKMNIRNAIAALIAGCMGILLALRGWGVWALVTQIVVNSLVSLILVFMMTRWYPSLKFNYRQIKDGLSFGKYMFFSSLLDGFVSRLDVFIIGRIFTTHTLGLYTRAQSLDSMTRSLSSASLLSVLFPAFAKMSHDKSAVKVLFHNYFEIIGFVFCLLAGISYVIAPAVFQQLFGTRWDEAAQYFQLLVLSGYAFPISSLMLTVIEAQGNSKSFFKAEVWKKIIFIPTYFLAYFFGVKIFLLAFWVACLLGVLVNMLYLRKEIDVDVKKLHLILWRYIASGPGLAVVVYYLMGVETSIVRSFYALMLFIFMYLGLHIWFKSIGLLHIKKQIPVLRTL